ncbi:PREDICTED: uncharacterized protein LOC105950580 [Erythranthe guttata]|uniref:uncharacterized protein LOC105950580 n=1 Tax=Erythranthe guttata TaxID=4155 RepID=UPI00064D7536|nr:PREDICTED: uncharacterized protein LOC105950580 [Erythranthe guttata]|eukprot:XP_012829401.1 PREDICTED: uncharacterized protein LOC105950580 [Erythranthe guttata]
MICEASLIVWDEASMANRHSIEAFEALLADICDSPLPFGGKIVLFGGDFRQTLPIVVNGSRASMITASLVSSALWGGIHRMQLCQNMRAKEDPNFIDLLLRIGNGVETFIFDDNIKIPSHMLVPFDDAATSLDRLIRDVYPNLDTFMQNPDAFVGRAILTPKNDCVDELNDLLMERFPGKMKEYVSFNATTDPLQQGEYADYLNTVSAGGLPPNILKLKKNCPIMLLRNLNPIQGLCNGTRLICRELSDNFIKAEIAVGDFKGNVVFIPRIPLEGSGCKIDNLGEAVDVGSISQTYNRYKKWKQEMEDGKLLFIGGIYREIIDKFMVAYFLALNELLDALTVLVVDISPLFL